MSDASSSPERFLFVRDGSHFWAFVVAPLWLLLHRLWLALLIYVVGYGALSFGFAFARVSLNTQLIVALLIALLMGSRGLEYLEVDVEPPRLGDARIRGGRGC